MSVVPGLVFLFTSIVHVVVVVLMSVVDDWFCPSLAFFGVALVIPDDIHNLGGPEVHTLDALFISLRFISSQLQKKVSGLLFLALAPGLQLLLLFSFLQSDAVGVSKQSMREEMEAGKAGWGLSDWQIAGMT